MSTQPAASPSPSAGPSEVTKPASQEPAQGPQAEPQTVQETVPDKPKSKPGDIDLPGVVRADDVREDDEIVKALGEEDRKSRTLPERDPDTGRFKAKQPDLPEGFEPPADEKPPSQKFKFLGKEYDSVEQVEQMHRTLQGMHKSKDKQVAEAEAARQEWAVAVDAWKAEAAKLAARVAELENQGGRGEGGVSPDAGDDAILKKVDMDAFEYLVRNGTVAQAGQYLVSEVMKLVREDVLPGVVQQFESQIAPFQQTAEQNRKVETMTQVTTQLADFKTLDGKVAFPELRDTTALYEIGRIWASEGHDPDALLDAKGLMSAVALYRLYNSLPAGPPEEPTTPPAPQVVAPGPAASVAADPGTGRQPVGRRSPMGPGLAAVVAALNSGDMIDPNLGFARRIR